MYQKMPKIIANTHSGDVTCELLTIIMLSKILNEYSDYNVNKMDLLIEGVLSKTTPKYIYHLCSNESDCHWTFDSLETTKRAIFYLIFYYNLSDNNKLDLSTFDDVPEVTFRRILLKHNIVLEEINNVLEFLESNKLQSLSNDDIEELFTIGNWNGYENDFTIEKVPILTKDTAFSKLIWVKE
jgi:hypothetical protein